MSVITISDGTIIDLPVGGIAVQTAVTPNGNYVFASIYDTKQIVRLEVGTGTLTAFSLPAGSQGAIQMYPTPDGTRLFICDQGVLLDRPASDKVYVMDVASGNIINTVIAGDAAHGVVVSKDGTRAYITNSLDHTVSVINTIDYSIVCTIPVGAKPNGISYWTSEGGQP
mgnify:FL=1